MAVLISAGDLVVGSQFIDPHRAGQRMAQVVTLLGSHDGTVCLELDDDTTFGAWVASYPETEQLELA